MTSYKNMEEVLQLINKKYVSLDTEKVKHNNERLKSTLWDLIAILKEQDPLFAELFERPYFGGSYYDDLKVGEPDEFDLDLLLVLPKVCEAHKNKVCKCVRVTPSNKPGFFWFEIEKGFYSGLDKYIKDGYVQTDLILNWLKSNVTKALDKLKDKGDSLYDYSIRYYSESGPALTLELHGRFGKMDVDLVPAFKFGPQHWPNAGFRSNNTNRSDFFIVPKKPRGIYYGERYWRASFQDQERELIKGKERLKPALRLLKKMRNNLVQTKISSYALKTLVLCELDTNYFYWNEPLADTFMKLLEIYKDGLFKGKIPYYWNKNNNLLDGINPATLRNHHDEISRLLKRIKDQHMTDPCVVARVILKEGSVEYKEFLSEYNRRTVSDHGLSDRSSDQGSSYHSFGPRSTPDPPDSASSSGFRNSGGAMQQTTESSTNGWFLALGLGAAAVAVVTVFGALNNNRNQNRRN